eukprot:765947-Hanusia_phi.AAC.5
MSWETPSCRTFAAAFQSCAGRSRHAFCFKTRYYEREEIISADAGAAADVLSCKTLKRQLAATSVSADVELPG